MNYVVEDYPSESDSEGEYKYDLGRVMDVNKLGPKPTYVKITHTNDAQFRSKVPWITDSVVIKSLLSEKHYWKIWSRNPDIKLQHTKV